MTITSAQLEQVRHLYEQGLYLQAYRLGETFGRLRSWEGSAARILAGRLAGNLGAQRMARGLHYLAWRGAPQDPEAIYFYLLGLLEYRGPLAAWECLETHGDLPAATPHIRSDLFALRARVLAMMRDFPAADHWLNRAEAEDAENPWLFVERADVLIVQDRYEDALAAARKSLEMRSWYRPGVQVVGNLLELLGRDEEALELLTTATHRLESTLVAAQLARLQRTLGQSQQLEETLQRIEILAPLMDKAFRGWLAALRCDAACARGDLAAACEHAASVGPGFYTSIAERLAKADGECRRVELAVPFVRQHHATCAPATLVAISRYWDMPADHLEVVEKICYDGTPHHSQRTWAVEQGFTAREFRVTWEAATALLDRGVPFTLSVVYPAGAHLQAVIGYDARRGTLLLRDPYHRHTGEAVADILTESQKAHGPRAMALVPNGRADLLAGITLPDAVLYDSLHGLLTALVAHDRPRAQTVYEAMLEAEPEHPLCRYARLSLASYDEDETTRLRCVEQLMARFPGEPNLLLMRLGSLRTLGRREDRLELLQQACASDGAEPILWLYRARELAEDARQFPEAMIWLQRAIRRRPDQAAAFNALADIQWRRREFAGALSLYRFAACIDDKREDFAAAYLLASRYLKRTDEALALLVDRFERFGRRSGLPARTLCWSFEQLDRGPEALEVLETAIERRPQDGDLLLFAAQVHGRYGRLDKVREFLERARPLCRRNDWLRTSSVLARYSGELRRALEMWQEVLATEPTAADAHRAVAHLLAAVEGPHAARAHVERSIEQFPHSYPINQLLIEHLRDDPQRLQEAVRRLVAINPADVWARRELVLVLQRLNRLEEARAEAQAAVQLDPADPFSHALEGRLEAAAGRTQQAREALRRALRLSVECDVAIFHLCALSERPQERRDALSFIQDQIIEQTLYGDALLAYRSCAAETLDPAELLASLRRALEVRPDLWQAWTAVVRQLLACDRDEEALSLARDATARFPLLPQTWHLLAQVHRARSAYEDELASLEQAHRVRPEIAALVQELATAYERRGDLERSQALLEQALARDPLDATLHGYMGGLLWKKGRRDEAIERLRRALQLEPGYDWAWGCLQAWGLESGRPELAAELARDLTRRRPGDPAAWLVLARVLEGPHNQQERLRALQRAIELNPRDVDAHVQRVRLLAEAGRQEEALAACRVPHFADELPVALRAEEIHLQALGGDLAGAAREMEALLTENASFVMGWALLGSWQEQLNRTKGALDAAERIVHLAPLDAQAYVNRGRLRLVCQQRPQAKTDFRRAFELNPDRADLLCLLFDLHLVDGEIGEAESVLNRLRTHSPGPQTMLRGLRLAAKNLDKNAALSMLAEMCRSTDAEESVLNEAADALCRANWDSGAREVLQKALDEEDARAPVGAQWGRRCAPELKRRDAWKRLELLRRRGDVGFAATASYFEELCKRKNRRLLRRFLRRYEPELAGHARTWAAVVCALYDLNDHRQAARWALNWPPVPEVTGQNLLLASLSLRFRRCDAAARKLNHLALKSPPNDCTWGHELWLALDDACAGDKVSAGDRLQRLPLLRDDPYHEFVQLLVQAVLAVTPETGREALPAARAYLQRARRKLPQFRQSRHLRRIYGAVLRRIATDVGGLKARLWRYWLLAGG